jgi:hypothetical protein
VLRSRLAVQPPKEHVMVKWSIPLFICLAIALVLAGTAGAADRVVLAELFGGTW